MSTDTKASTDIASAWLAKFGAAASVGDAQAATALFLGFGWLRDILVLTWTHRSRCGSDDISAYLVDNLRKAQITNVKLDVDNGISPAMIATPAFMVEAAMTFETPIVHGRGLVRLLQDQGGQWKALSVFLMATDLKGHEEKDYESGYYDGHTKTWNEVHAEEIEQIETDPYVLIVGAGQNGLNVGARFRQMGIPALLIEQTARVGDTWRKRYPTLTLHTPNTHHSFLYHPFPKSWPTHTPRDKVASWMEQYAEHQDLVIWTSSTLLPTPSYDLATKRWTVHVLRDGTRVTLHPHHIVMAIGSIGRPFVPQLPGRAEFKGEAYHGLEFKGGARYKGKKTIVVGAGNTAADVCQDLVARGAASVTMVQRSSTIVVDARYVIPQLRRIWPEPGDPSVGDFRFGSMPLGLLKRMHIEDRENRVNEQKAMIDGLRAAGLNVNEGPEGAGQLLLLHMRFGGFWLDVGVADMIIAGKITIKQGSEPAHFTPHGLVLQDGTSLDADLVVFATGYDPVEGSVGRMFGDKVEKETSPLWGMNEEGEINRAYTPSGCPGLWYALGDFFYSRFYSKPLAMQIKAREIGLVKD